MAVVFLTGVVPEPHIYDEALYARSAYVTSVDAGVVAWAAALGLLTHDADEGRVLLAPAALTAAVRRPEGWAGAAPFRLLGRPGVSVRQSRVVDWHLLGVVPAHFLPEPAG